MYKPKFRRVIYIEPISVNSASVENSLPASPYWKEIKIIVDTVSKMYRENVDSIVQECNKDATALERVPSPLKLFVDCFSQLQKSMSRSAPARALFSNTRRHGKTGCNGKRSLDVAVL